jgi:hypothetical protein
VCKGPGVGKEQDRKKIRKKISVGTAEVSRKR